MRRSILPQWGRVAGVLALVALFLTASLTSVAAETVETAVRVIAVDGGTGALTIIDPESGEVTGRFTTPTGGFAPVYASDTGRYLLANHFEGNQVTIVDAGLSLADHGDHVDLVTTPPFVLATVTTGAAPAHYWAHDGVIAIHNDGDGTITLLNESELATAIAPITFSLAQPDHTSVAILDDAVLVGYYDLGRVDAYSMDGTLLEAGIGDCAGAHGEARFADTVAFACADGLLLVTRTGDAFTVQKVTYPVAAGAPIVAAERSATPATADEESAAPRIGSIAAHDDNEVLVGDFGQGLALITPSGEGVMISVLSLPANPLGFSYDHAGEQLAVLTDDGAVHGVDPVTGTLLWTTPAITPYTEIAVGEGFEFYPSLAASDTAAYVADPTTGEVVEVNLTTGAVTNRFAIGGEPARVALVLARGVQH